METNCFEGDYPILDEKFAILKIVGSGAYSDVGLGVTTAGERCAVKMLNKFDPEALEREFKILDQLDHKNLVKTYGAKVGKLKYPDGEEREIAYMAMEFLEKGELFDYIFFPKSGFSEKIARYLFREILEGIQSCHDSGIAHRDLKTENIMLDGDYVCKVADFGLSTFLMGPKNDGKLYTPLGTLNYACPEIHARKPYNGTQADAFSLGVVLFVLVTAKIPFGRAVMYDGYYKWIMQKKFVNYWTLMSSKIIPVTDEFKDLVSKLVIYESAERLTVKDALEHPWFKLDTASSEEVLNEFKKRDVQVQFGRKMQSNDDDNKKKGGYYRGDDAETFEDIYGKFDRVTENYVESGNPYKLSVVGSSEQDVLKALYLYGCAQKAKVVLNDEIKKLTLTWDRVAVQELAEGEETEEEVDFTRDGLEIEASIKINEDGEYVVEFLKKNGSKFDFYNEFEKLSEELKA